MINKSAIILIQLYQKFISPYKGYCCAYKVHHNDVSCSQFAKLTIQNITRFCLGKLVFTTLFISELSSL